LAEQRSGRERERILGVGVLDRRFVGGRMESGLAVREVEGSGSSGDRIPGTRFEETRRAGMVLGRAGPEDAVLPLDALPGDAGIVGDAARGRQPQLVEDLARPGELEAVLPSERSGDVLDDAPVLARIAR